MRPDRTQARSGARTPPPAEPTAAPDITQADTLLQGIDTDAVVADKAFDSDALLHTITGTGAKAVIPPRSNRSTPREYDVRQCKHRNLIERLFCRMIHFRRIATRYDILAQRFASFVALVAAFVWLA